MKKLISVILLLFVFYYSGQAARIINSFDIARWYLDADLVLICNVTHTDTLKISSYDAIVEDGYHLRYDILREKYHLSIDSIIKGEQSIDGTMDSIFTPYFSTQSIYEKKEFKGLNSDGDSIFYMTMKMFSDYNDDGYFRIKSDKQYLVILRKTEIGYVIDYKSECDSSTMALIQEIKEKGEDYFSFLLPPKTDTLAVYDYYCESMNPSKIDTTIFAYQHDTLSIRNIKREFCCPYKLVAVVKSQLDSLIINVVNPAGVDCLCDCSYGYTVKIQIMPFDTLHLIINNENFTILGSDLFASTKYLKDEKVLIYPNPCSDFLYINGIQAKRIEVTDINGKTQGIELQDPNRIDLSCLKPGIYVVSIFTDNGIRNEKIIKE